MNKTNSGASRFNIHIPFARNRGPVELMIVNTKETISIPVVKRIKCFYCHKKVVPNLLFVDNVTEQSCTCYSYCPKCESRNVIDIQDYSSPEAKWTLIERPERNAEFFTELIMKISKKFCETYNEALYAHELNLRNIAGIGFRKSLEYLIKDYCIYLHPDSRDKIIANDLGICVAEYINSQTVRDFAERAVWLGNDESHYEKRWEDKGIDDLIDLIRLLINSIVEEEKRGKIVVEMPKQKKKNRHAKECPNKQQE